MVNPRKVLSTASPSFCLGSFSSVGVSLWGHSALLQGTAHRGAHDDRLLWEDGERRQSSSMGRKRSNRRGRSRSRRRNMRKKLRRRWKKKRRRRRWWWWLD